MQIVQIKSSEIKLPDLVAEKEYPATVLSEMADEIKAFGWPSGKELGVKKMDEGYQVHASFAWFKAGLLAGVDSIPCVIY